MEGARANNAEQVKSEVTDKLLDRVKIEKEKDKPDLTPLCPFFDTVLSLTPTKHNMLCEASKSTLCFGGARLLLFSGHNIV
jgi:hypothetical protein